MPRPSKPCTLFPLHSVAGTVAVLDPCVEEVEYEHEAIEREGVSERKRERKSEKGRQIEGGSERE